MRSTELSAYAHLGGPFAKIHAESIADGEWDTSALDVDAYTPRELDRGRRSFVLRALDEQRSLVAFSELLSELAESGAPIDVIGSLTRVVADEARHVDLCGRIVERLGGWPIDAPEPTWVRSDRRLPLRARILKTIVGSLCIGETISVAMLAGVREDASDPFVQRVLTRMLSDESFHSRFGWWWLEAHAPTLDVEEREMLDRWLPRALGALETMARPPASTAARYVASPFGSMSPLDRAIAVERVIERKILPGLEKAGHDARGAWERRATAA
jgi:hypothetical protein